MPVINRIADFHNELTAWRRDLHMHPETAFEERRTSDFVAGKLAGACLLGCRVMHRPDRSVHAPWACGTSVTMSE